MSRFKKIVFMVSFVAVLCFSFNFNARIANAITADEIRAQIALLMAQISELQKQLGQTEVWCHDFDRNLKYGNEGEEVRALQLVLDKQGFTPIPHKYGDKNYGNFEEYTASAVVGFQQKYKQDILAPWGLEYGTGYVGKTTREKLNELYGCGTTPVITCENLWWYDNNTQYCQQKQFCGAFMYLGLRTFATKQECETALGQSAPSITVLSPNGGEQWVKGQTYQVKWENLGTDTIDIYLYSSGFAGCRTSSKLAENILANLGEYSVVIPFDMCESGNYRMQIWLPGTFEIPQAGEVFAPKGLLDASDNYFSIVEPTSTTCHTSDLWAWAYCSPTCKCDAGEGDCDTDADCADGLYCAYNVGVNYSQDAKMDVCEIKQMQEKSITVLSPNGGEEWITGGVYDIVWESSGYDISADKIRVAIVDYENSSNLVESDIAYNFAANIGLYSWTIPSNFNIGSEYKIKIEICGNGKCYSDLSDSYFSIVAAGSVSCHTTPLWAWDYCSSSCKCDAGQGDCDTDADCADGLYCAYNVGANYGQDVKMDVCEVKTSTTCATGMILCGGNCVDVKTDIDNCGSCGNQCATGDTCANGICASGSSVLKNLGESCSATSECQSGFCVDGVCCNNACAGRDCQTCGALSSQGIGHCGYVKTSSADPRNDCSNGTTVSNGCESNDCSGKNWSCGVVQNHDDGGCPACQTCDGINATCKAYANNLQDVNGAKTCESCKYCMNGSCVNIANGQDLFSECSETGCGTGNCDGAGKCGWFTSGEHGCAKCKTCDGATSLSCKYIAKGQKDAQGSKVCNQPHYRCDGRANCTNPSTLTQTECFNLGSSDCAGLCPHWCNGESMCKECWTNSMRVYSSDYCSGTGMGVYSGSCNQLGGSCKCFYERYLYE